MLILDAEFSILHANPALLAMTGFSENRLIGRHVSEIADPQSNPELFDYLCRPDHHSLDRYDGEVWLRFRHDGQFPTHVLIDPLQLSGERISHYLLLALNIAKQKQLESELRFHAQIDPLTCLGNRKQLFDRLDNALASAKRFDYNVAVLFLDLDGFKRVNDQLGHGEGDRLLQEVAKRLLQCVRQIDSVARLGGDEFVVILNGTDKEAVADTAGRIIDNLTLSIPNGNASLQVSASIGIAIFPDDGRSGMALLKCADQAMYRAKALGKRQFCWSTQPQPSPPDIA